MPYTSSYTGLQLDESVGKIQILFNLLYPVGSVYISTANVSPATLFGGTWEQIQDKFLLSAGSSYTAGDAGGSATNNHTHTMSHTHTLSHTHTMAHTHTLSHTHSITGKGSIGATTLSISQIPSHNHSFSVICCGYSGWGAASVAGYALNWTHFINQDCGTSTQYRAWTGLNATIGNTGGGGSHTHSFSGSAVTSGGASTSTTSAASTSTTSDASSTTTSAASTSTTSVASDTNNMPPYLVVYMWKRVA